MASFLHNSNRKIPFHQQINCGENIHLAPDLLWKHRSIFDYSPLLSNYSLTNRCFLSKKSGILNAQLFASSVNILCNNTKVELRFTAYIWQTKQFPIFWYSWTNDHYSGSVIRRIEVILSIVPKHIYKKSSILPSKHQL